MLPRILFLLVLASSAAAAPSPSRQTFLERHRYDCHDGDARKWLDLAAQPEDSSLVHTLAACTDFHDKVVSVEIPPEKRQPHSKAKRAEFTRALPQNHGQRDSGLLERVIRRHSQVMCRHTLEDLIVVRTKLKSLLTEDGKTHGFDTALRALDLSFVHLQRHIAAAKPALVDAVKFGSALKKPQVPDPFEASRQAGRPGRHRQRLDDGSAVHFSIASFPAMRPQFRSQRDDPCNPTHKGSDNDTHAQNVLPMPPAATPHTLGLLLSEREKFRPHPQLSAKFPLLQKNGQGACPAAGLAIRLVAFEGPLVEDEPRLGNWLLFGNFEARKAKLAEGKPAITGVACGEILSVNPEADARYLLGQFLSAAFGRPVSLETVQFAQRLDVWLETFVSSTTPSIAGFEPLRSKSPS